MYSQITSGDLFLYKRKMLVGIMSHGEVNVRVMCEVCGRKQPRLEKYLARAKENFGRKHKSTELMDQAKKSAVAPETVLYQEFFQEDALSEFCFK